MKLVCNGWHRWLKITTPQFRKRICQINMAVKITLEECNVHLSDSEVDEMDKELSAEDVRDALKLSNNGELSQRLFYCISRTNLKINLGVTCFLSGVIRMCSAY
jgi:hypothetical protein